MVAPEYHCPECGSLYDLEFCFECGYERPDGKEEPKKFRVDKEGHRTRKKVRN